MEVACNGDEDEESGSLCVTGLSPGFGLYLFSISCFYFSVLLLLFLHALAFMFFVTPSFSLPVFSFFLFGHVRRVYCVQHG